MSAVDDPAERDADVLAARVVSLVQRHALSAGTSHDLARTVGAGDNRIRRKSDRRDPAAGPDGGEVAPETATRIRQSAGHGSALPEVVRTPLESAFGADFSRVVVHEASPLAPEVGATAFTHGRDVHFAPGTYQPTRPHGVRLLAHELAHVVQQGDGDTTASAHRSTIYRHASFEHLMLGQVDPLQLRSIPDQRKFLMLDDGDTAIDLKNETAYHVLRQERDRLRAWQQSEPKSLAEVKPEWQVHAVEIQSRTPSTESRRTTTVCTYGEMNMLADYFGSPDEVYAAEAHTLWKLLQTERAEYYTKLGEMLDELMARDFVVKPEVQKGWLGNTTVNVKWYLPEDAPAKDHYDPADYTVRDGESRLTKQAFAGDQRSGVAKADLISMNGLENLVGTPGLLPKDQGLANFYGPGQGTGTAWGVTARNACHFAPESWRSWETYHRKAIELAGEAGRFREAAAAPGTTEAERARWLAKADAMANDAWVHNGFADHYLQDSFASGHLINKTLVMQWYMEEIDTWSTMGPTQEVWDRLMMMSAQRQPGLGTADYSKAPGVAPRNPQAAANATTTDESWDASGLQTIGLSDHGKTALGLLRSEPGAAKTAAEWATLAGLTLDEIRAGLNQLIRNDFARVLPDSEPPRVQLEARWAPKGGDRASQDGEASARTVTSRFYHEWLKNSLIQAGAGALHDHFCKQGLWVATGEGERPFKIYGDDRMLSAGAGDGVAFAAETAQMSQASIRDVLDSGAPERGMRGIGRILARFPSHVIPDFANASDVYKAKDFGLDKFTPPAAAPIPLAAWHDRLHDYMAGKYLKQLFNTWSHHYASQTSDLTSFDQISPHAGAEF